MLIGSGIVCAPPVRRVDGRGTARTNDPLRTITYQLIRMNLGWDIGGVNTKLACVRDGRVVAVVNRPYELQRDPAALVTILRELADEALAACGVPATTSCGPRATGYELRHAVTMTAELSQMFRTKREGVAFVLDAVERAFPDAPINVLTVDGVFISPDAARHEPLAVAAANWAATAALIGTCHRDVLLLDIGTTSTDIIPVVDGAARPRGRTDLERLASGELVYTGALRTPVEAILDSVTLSWTRSAGPKADGAKWGPPRGGPDDVRVRVSAEGFALAGDAHLWRGDLDRSDYTVTAPDGRPATREFARERLARVVCADRDMLGDDAVDAIAAAIADAQMAHVTHAVREVLARHPQIRAAVVTGLGTFLGTRAARSAALDVVPWSDDLGAAAARCAPAACVALLLDGPPSASVGVAVRRPDDHIVDTVIKLGGGLLAHPDDFGRALEELAQIARRERVVIVPGGGPFADAVRAVGRTTRLSDDAAHWMAILGMDQYAHLVVSRLSKGVLVTSAGDITAALLGARIPVLAPFDWLRQRDPLPHSWDVTSDSIAAWLAGELRASRLLLLKPPGARGAIVDAHFASAVPQGVEVTIVPADELSSISKTASTTASG
jgi:uncharacterized hydantoinase/oxoprolinase family protein/aspartokinase-like uncharacterized kinase